MKTFDKKINKYFDSHVSNLWQSLRIYIYPSTLNLVQVVISSLDVSPMKSAYNDTGQTNQEIITISDHNLTV